MISVPNIEEVKTLILNASRNLAHYVAHVRVELLMISEGIIIKKPDAINTIYKTHSHHAQTEKGIKATQSLQSVCDVMNEFAKQHGDYFPKLMSDHKAISGKMLIPGLREEGGYIVVCHKYIHEYERTGSASLRFITTTHY